MARKISPTISIILILLFVVSMFAGCVKEENEANTGGTAEGQTVQQVEEKIVFPLKDPVKFTYWTELDPKGTNYGITNHAEKGLYIELEKRTGVKIEFIHPTSSKPAEEFNLMVASGNLPDIFFHNKNFNNLIGGPDTAIKEGIIIPLNDMMPKYTPNLSSFYEKFQEYDKELKTNSGDFYNFPDLKGAGYRVASGFIIRKDWLDALGLEVPTTLDEWYTVLTAFKGTYTDTPFTMLENSWRTGSFILSAYGAGNFYYQDNGKVLYGRMQPAFKGFLTTLRKWYDDGLLDPDFATQNNQTRNNKIINGVAGATIGAGSGNLAFCMNTVLDADPDSEFELVGAPSPVLKKGDIPSQPGYSWPYEGQGACITTQCKNKEIAALWLDYVYSEEGNWLTEWGVNGETYEVVDGKARKLETLPGQTMVSGELEYRYFLDAMPRIRGILMGNTIIPKDDPSIALQDSLTRAEQAQKNALEIWAKADISALIPAGVALTEEEDLAFKEINAPIGKYSNEMLLKFILGEASLEQFDDYVDQIVKMGINDAIAIQQVALDRYNNR